jgi:hypothetical protein
MTSLPVARTAVVEETRREGVSPMTAQEASLPIGRRRRVVTGAVLGAALAGAALSAGVALTSAGAVQHGGSSPIPMVIPPEAVPASTNGATTSPVPTIPAPSAVAASISPAGTATSPQSSMPDSTASTPSAAPEATTTPGPAPSDPQLNPGPGGPPILAGPAAFC